MIKLIKLISGDTMIGDFDNLVEYEDGEDDEADDDNDTYINYDYINDSNNTNMTYDLYNPFINRNFINNNNYSIINSFNN